MLRIGDMAPEFELADQSGSTVTLNQLVADGDVVLYFYPADFSPVCTAEACAFRDSYEDVSSVGVRVVGVSPQGVGSHQRFSNRFSIPFPLLSDPQKITIKAYGVDGPLGFGVRRATFLIDAKKTVRNRVVSDLFIGSHTELLNKTVRERV
ncbi:MAG: peroxiredoxin [Pseudomonadales bacterium]|jgi:peroxiredoxin Q/BCP|nr:peroxiredoxin [Pseudomonadales bacterium]MDP6470263.1 peroxiredoxin [Pseudomonadales bacterium]MDP6827169.1 peroxiredoxin [Pseudomonadales bacterium]MDP6972400.1 peroxiredoxin [Pseudomonadales bacterium]|tara:strand:- start:1211 stop:1663 length:453 start_codon:yes stop_codon:yes gene_type:complete